MQLIREYIKLFWFLLFVIDILSKYVWVVPVNSKRVVTITNAFQKCLDEPNSKPNIIWLNKDSEIYSKLIKSCRYDNDTEIYAIFNQGRSVVTRRFIKILKTKILKYVTSISKNACIDKFDVIVNEYNKTPYSN